MMSGQANRCEKKMSKAVENPGFPANGLPYQPLNAYPDHGTTCTQVHGMVLIASIARSTISDQSLHAKCMQ